MLAEEVLIPERGGQRLDMGIDGQSLPCHGRKLFHHHGHMNRFCGRGAPAKRRMPRDQGSRAGQGIAAGEQPDNGRAGVGFIIGVDLWR